MDVIELIFVRPAPVVMFAPLGVIPDGLFRNPVEVEGVQKRAKLGKRVCFWS